MLIFWANLSGSKIFKIRFFCFKFLNTIAYWLATAPTMGDTTPVATPTHTTSTYGNPPRKTSKTPKDGYEKFLFPENYPEDLTKIKDLPKTNFRPTISVSKYFLNEIVG